MNIDQGWLELVAVGVVTFVFRVVFGLIGKNEVKSDQADRQIHGELKEIRLEIKDVIKLYRDNDHTLFSKLEKLTERVARLEALSSD